MKFPKDNLTKEKFRLRLKGFSLLKNQNNLGLWRNLKEQFLSISPLGRRNTVFNKYIFGSSYNYAELVIHQYCVDIFLPNWLGGEILENLAKPAKSKITKPLPFVWVEILEGGNFTVNKFGIKFKFSIFILFKFIQNVRYIFLVIYRSIKFKSNIVNNQKSIYFCDLTSKNFPPNLKSDYNFDIFSWYLSSNIFDKDIRTIYHSVIEKQEIFYKNAEIKYNYFPTSFVNFNATLLKFISWAIFAITLCLIDLIMGKWHHAIILGEAAKNKIVEMKKDEELSKAYYFPYSSQCYRPMWTYGVSQKGIEIVSYFYSTFEQPKLKDRINNQKFEFYLYNWPISLVWNDAQGQLLKLNSKFIINEEIVGPIFDTDSSDSIPPLKNFTIAVFDSQIHKKQFHFGVSTLADYYEFNKNVNLFFLKDIISCSEMFNISILHKIKRNIGKRSVESYTNYVNKLNENLNYLQVESSISAIKVIDMADMVISSPFTSTALYGLMRNKPTFYYDPSGWIQKEDPAAHGIPVISGITELTQIIENILNKNLSLNLSN